MDTGTIAFSRLHALLQRGYILGAQDGGDDFIELVHPRMLLRRNRELPVTLWSTGSVQVGSRTITGDDDGRFAEFVRSVRRPTLYDRYGRPFLTKGKTVAVWYLLMLLLAYVGEVAFGWVLGWSGDANPFMTALVLTLPAAVLIAGQPRYG